MTTFRSASLWTTVCDAVFFAALMFPAMVLTRLYHGGGMPDSAAMWEASAFGLRYTAMSLTFFLIGAAFLTIHSEHRAGFAARCLIYCMSGMALYGLTGLLLAVLKLYSLPRTLGLVAAGWCVVLLASRRFKARPELLGTPQGPARGSGRWDFVVLLLLACFLFTPPFETIWGGFDASSYLNTAKLLNNTGRIVQVDPALQALGPSGLDYRYWGPKHPACKYAGYYVTDVKRGVVVPQFFHLYPMLLSAAERFLGPDLIWANVLLGLLSLLAFHGVARALFPRWIAWVVTFGLAFNAQQIWSARSSLSEILVQSMLWTAVGILLQNVDPEEPDRGREQSLLPAAAVIIGAVAFVRIDAIMPLLPLCFFPLFMTERPDGSYVVQYELIILMLAGMSVIYAVTIAAPYTYEVLSFSAFMSAGYFYLTVFIVLCISGIGSLMAAGGRNPTPLRSLASDANSPSTVRYVIGFVVLAVLIFAYFFYPHESFQRDSFFSHMGKKLPTFDNEAALRLGWFFSPIGLAMAAGGLIWMILHERSRRYLLVGFVCLPYFQYLVRILDSPAQVWAFRRLLPAVFPFIVICIGYFLHRLGQRRKEVAWLVGVVFLVATISIGRSLIGVNEYRDSYRQLKEFLSSVPEKSLVIVDRRFEVAHWQGPPIEYLLGYYSYPLLLDDSTGPILDAAVKHFPQVFVITKYLAPMPNSEARQEGIRAVTIDVPYLIRSYSEFPKGEARYRTALSLYRLVAP